MKKEYSIKVLFGNITKLLHESGSLDTEYYVQNGLDASIITFDEGVHASDSAYITRNPITKKKMRPGYLLLSVSFTG